MPEKKEEPKQVQAPEEVLLWASPSGRVDDFKPCRPSTEGAIFDEPASRGYVGYQLVRYVKAGGQ
jgi:hypothetical protein